MIFCRANTAIAIIVLVGLGTWVIGTQEQPDPESSEAYFAQRPLTKISDRILQVAAQLNVPDKRVGGRLYMEHCAACHGKNLEGNANWRDQNADGSPRAPPHDDSGHTWHHDDQTLFLYTKQGGKAFMAGAGITNFQSGMPGYQGILSDQEIADVLAFIKSHWGERSVAVQRERTRALRKADHE